MNELSPDSKRLLQTYRATNTLSEQQRTNVLDALRGRIAGGALPDAAIDVAPAQVHVPWSLFGVGSATLGKTVLLIALAGTGAILGARERAAPLPPPAQHVEVERAAQPAVVEPALPQPAREEPRKLAPKRRKSTPRVATEPTPAVVESRAAQAPTVEAPAVDVLRDTEAFTPPRAPAPPRSEVAASPPAITLDEEMELMRSATEASRRGEYVDALRAVEAHQARFPQGSLADSREVTRMLILCALGRADEARARAAKFLRVRPHSPFAARVSALQHECVADPRARGNP